MKYLANILFYLLSFYAIGQEATITGQVVDQNNQPLSFVNVLVTDASDNSIVKGASTDESGKFIITGLDFKTYILQATFLGFESYTENLTIANTTSVKNIILKDSTENLEEVVVTANKPTLKKEVDRLVFNVANTSLVEGTMLDVLRSTPGVLVLGGNISVKNSTPTVFINGRKVQLSASEVTQLLENSSANSIQKVEVITNPSAKYDAESGVVLDIVMTKNLITGYRGNVFSNYTQGVFPRYNAGINQFYKTDKVNINLNYNYNQSKINRDNINEINYLDNNNTISENWYSTLNRNTTSKTHNANLNFDYFLSERSTLSLTSNFLYLPYFDYLTRGYTTVNDLQGTNNYNFNVNNNSNDDKYNLGVDLDFVQKFKNESSLAINVHMTKYDYKRHQQVESQYYFVNSNSNFDTAFTTDNNQTTDIITSQIDYNTSLSDNSSFSTGIKTSVINTDSGITQFDIDPNTGNTTFNTQNSDTYQYDESIFAAYLDYQIDWEKWSFSGGLRVEQTDIEGQSISTNGLNNQDYLEWFPTLNLSWQTSENINLYTNYKRSINRPDFQDLNPFNFFLNDNTIVTGNPILQPTFTNKFVLGTSIKSRYTFEFYYKDISDQIHEIPIQDNTNNILIYQPTNIGKATDFGLDFITYFDVLNSWSVYFVTSFYNIQEEAFLDNQIVKQDQWSNYSVLSNDFSLLKDKSLSANFTVIYTSKNLQGFKTVDGRLISDLSISKKLFKDKATLSLAFADLFNKQDFTVRTKYGRQDNYNFHNQDNRYVKLGFNYKFGNTSLQTNERTKDKKERDRLE
ncbi:outer membrane beta-barrel family protein [Mesoflavibacter sp. CH_XMU1422-2]|uniref:outer membrane beta-barrel family protein n=1 Tax=Mesoflavibacter sp. CH_XMU1422-2 TaxID=3107770 RepID=UPI0030093509